MTGAAVLLAAGLLAATAAGATAVVAAGTNPAPTGYTHPTYPTSTTTTTTLPQCPDEPCGTNPQGNTTTTGETTSTLSTTTLAPTTTSTPTTSSTASTSTSSTTSPTASTSTTSPTTTTASSLPPSTSSTPPAPSSSTSTTTLPQTLDIGAASVVCSADVPFVNLTFGNQPELNGLTGTITFLDVNGDFIESHQLVYASGATLDLLYPGATVDADGNATDWPGWMLNADGFWVLDPSDAIWREGLTIVAEINPTATTTVTYPPSTAACDSPEGPFPTTTPPAGALPPTR